MYNYYGSELMSGFLFMLAILLIAIVIYAMVAPSKSKKYREFLTDMYVAAKVKLLAKKDNLDLEVAAKDYKLWRKKEKLTSDDITFDKAVEEDLKEQLAEEIVKKA